MNKLDIKKRFVSLKGNERSKFFRDLKSYVYVYCEIDEDNRRIPIYIGKGKSERCFSHLDNLDNLTSAKSKKINNLFNDDKLGIDILAHGLDNKTAEADSEGIEHHVSKKTLEKMFHPSNCLNVWNGLFRKTSRLLKIPVRMVNSTARKNAATSGIG